MFGRRLGFAGCMAADFKEEDSKMSFDLRNVDMVGPDKTNRSCYSEVQSGISFNVSSWARFGKKISLPYADFSPIYTTFPYVFHKFHCLGCHLRNETDRILSFKEYSLFYIYCKRHSILCLTLNVSPCQLTLNNSKFCPVVIPFTSQHHSFVPR